MGVSRVSAIVLRSFSDAGRSRYSIRQRCDALTPTRRASPRWLNPFIRRTRSSSGMGFGLQALIC